MVSDGIFVDVVAIDEILLDDDMHHGEGQRRVGPGPDWNMPVGQPGRARPHRINDNQLGARLSCLLNEWPVMRVGAERIAGPKNDVFRVHETFGIDAADSGSVGETCEAARINGAGAIQIGADCS